jgi:hypothetical protein
MGAMKSMSAFVGIAANLVMAGCGQTSSTDIVGHWSSVDGGSLTLNLDGTFFAADLPATVFFLPNSSDPPLTGRGHWHLEKHNLLWDGDRGIIKLDFDEMQNKPSRTGISAIVSGTGTSTSLFQWKGKEGGDRYELKRNKE